MPACGALGLQGGGAQIDATGRKPILQHQPDGILLEVGAGPNLVNSDGTTACDVGDFLVRQLFAAVASDRGVGTTGKGRSASLAIATAF